MRKRNKDSVTSNENVTLDVTLYNKEDKEWVVLPDSSQIRLDKLLSKPFSASMKAILEVLPPKFHDNLRCGITGPTFRDLAVLIEVTA